MRVLVTGGSGFIAHHVVKRLVDKTDWFITILDRLDFAGNMNRLAELNLPKGRVRFIFHDLRAEINDHLSSQIGAQDYVLHLAAATHVDRSIQDPLGFVMDNVVGTCNLLNWARKAGCERFVYFSTDEVFGPALNGEKFKEWDRYKSGNPYSASKAGAEELCIAFHNTYKVPVIVMHTMNNIGERQHPEKFVPMTIRKVRDGEKVLIHADRTKTRAGSRFYIYAGDVADASLFLIENGVSGEKYNISGEREIDNLSLAKMIAEAVGKPLGYEMLEYHKSRPGHDLRYDVDGSLMKSMGWRPEKTFEESLIQTVKWTLENPRWL